MEEVSRKKASQPYGAKKKTAIVLVYRIVELLEEEPCQKERQEDETDQYQDQTRVETVFYENRKHPEMKT